MFVFRFLLSEMKLLILASVLAFYSLSRYSPLDGFSLTVFVFEKLLLLKFFVVRSTADFRDFYFYDFRFKRDDVHGMEKVCGWDFKAEVAKNYVCLSFFAVGNETAHSCFCPRFLFFVAILAIR